MPNSVRFFDSAMSGAPALSGTAGALIGVLDACLVDGFGSVTVNSLVVASNVATATVSAGHQFAMIGNTGPVIRIAGASPSGLNGDWRVTVTNSTVFTFATTGISDQTATGTITAKRAPAGFSKAFSDTNKAAYRSDDVTGTRLYLHVDDSTTTYARVRGYESMTGIDADLVGPFPTDAQLSGGGYVYKSNTASSATRVWSIMSDGRAFYFFCDSANNGAHVGGLCFFDVVSYAASDPFGCALISSVSSTGSFNFQTYSETGGWLARRHTQTGTSVGCGKYSHGRGSGIGYVSGEHPYPSPVDNSMHLWPIECWDSNNNPRGLIPGVWNPIHDNSVPHGLIVSNVPQLPNRDFITQYIGSSSYKCAVDLTGPWR